MESKITEEDAQRQIELLKEQQKMLELQDQWLQDALNHNNESTITEFCEKSRLTECDLSAALKLQDDYTRLQCDIQNLFLYVFQYDSKGKENVALATDNEYIEWIHSILSEAIKEGRFKPREYKKE
jgi:hypothetical protein